MEFSSFLVILGILLAVLVLSAIPFLIRLAQLFRSLGELVGTTDRSIGSLLLEINETLRIVNRLMVHLEHAAGNIKGITEPVAEIADELRKVKSAIIDAEGYLSRLKDQIRALGLAITATIKALIAGLKQGGVNERKEEA